MIHTFKQMHFSQLKKILKDPDDFFVILYTNISYSVGETCISRKLNPVDGFNQEGYVLHIYSDTKENIYKNSLSFYKVIVPDNNLIFVCKKEDNYTILSDSITICDI